MKTLKIINGGLLVIIGMLAVTAVITFVNGKIFLGICNILWIGCEILVFLSNKKDIEFLQKYNKGDYNE